MGLTSRISKKLGIAPRKGPKKGMTLVTPTKTDTSGVYGISSSEQPMKHSTPMMRESSSLPRTKPEKMRSTLALPRKTQ